MTNPNRFYTYAYLREDGTPYYVGKGKGKRIYSNQRSINKPTEDRIIFLKQNLTEEEAFKHEIYMIAVFGRKDLGTGILHNKTNGGEGGSGRVITEEMKNQISDKLKGQKFSEDRRKNISKALKGKSAVWNIGNTYNKGKKFTEEQKKRLSESRKGMIFSDEHRKNLSIAHQGHRWWTNGQINTRGVECPGEGWFIGRTL